MNTQTEQELRFVVTQKCNFNCTFCHGEGLQTSKETLLEAEDFRFLFAVGKREFGMRTTTFSGGEPLVRRDIVDIAREVYKEDALITLTTNGSLLGDKLDIGEYLNKVNISIHSLNEEVYGKIVGKADAFNKAISGIRKFRDRYPGVEICINSTLVKGANSSEESVLALASFAKSIGASIKYVELFPSTALGFVPLQEAMDILKRNGFISIPSGVRKMALQKESTEINFTKIFCAAAEDSINPRVFCRNCNDLFVSPDGKIKPCRVNLREVDILKAVREKRGRALAWKIDQSLKLLGRDCAVAKCVAHPRVAGMRK